MLEDDDANLNAQERNQLVSAETLKVYQRLGYPVIMTSTRTGQGLEELKSLLHNKTSILVGQSGVGKSSLLNALLPQANARVGALSEWSGLGAHTTSHAELHFLPSGGNLIDCAGFRDFATWHLTLEEVQQGFREISQAALDCKFRDCSHISEPAEVCGVKRALEEGKIETSRMMNFRYIMNEVTA
ncbi:hypothetical protein GUITHDRAFT_155035 [Guillardia theta CCMP2712]|uniref:EngC GTPase domain-containing protein n=2 Tax=Guillardia theta TaxID=55529 RepID=L1ILG5_GUITC|nr:hypothetical protein GUITHDRAFT_155035 [Guillardia theta CCMP2712]EKX37103.1 hypothetical protein GUITHDRAFT_155035 [Guillardia theta CCMP2712]|eukprot:XP_005824083.1 hypothetical protein GUITHDRAFT_155035 [Guillardia theta CCMP2712]